MRLHQDGTDMGSYESATGEGLDRGGRKAVQSGSSSEHNTRSQHRSPDTPVQRFGSHRFKEPVFQRSVSTGL